MSTFKKEGEMNKQNGSRFPGFYKLSVQQRIKALSDLICHLSDKEEWALMRETLPYKIADRMSENVIGVFGLPLGVAVNFKINGKSYVIPMAIEETSVVAAASNSARLISEHGSLTAVAEDPIMEAQIQVINVPDFSAAAIRILSEKKNLLRLANRQDPTLVSVGGGAKDLYVRKLQTVGGPMLIVHLSVDVRDAMGANTVNTMAEALGPEVAKITGGEVICQIITNLCDKSLVRSRFEIQVDCLARAEFSGREVAERIVSAYHFADADPYRAATHNKGVMNGIDGILIATGNDWRAVEAACHAYTARDGRYRSLSKYQIEGDKLIGEIELPIAVGVVGGVTRFHPGVRIVHKLMGITYRRELAEIVAAAGLVQNFSALRMLVTEGIQRGHMRLNAPNTAYFSRATIGNAAIEAANQFVRQGLIVFDRAKERVRKRWRS
ncbi:MAG: hydroxymethylglutaryl-CoA reductase, degradative [Patescibacteria group bacterium]